jgi:hypothetical protein
VADLGAIRVVRVSVELTSSSAARQTSEVNTPPNQVKVVIAARGEKITSDYLCECQVGMYISKRIYIECGAMFEYSKAVPFLRYDWSKSWYQMYTMND